MYCADQPLSSPKGPSSFTMMTAHCATEPYFRLPAAALRCWHEPHAQCQSISFIPLCSARRLFPCIKLQGQHAQRHSGSSSNACAGADPLLTQGSHRGIT